MNLYDLTILDGGCDEYSRIFVIADSSLKVNLNKEIRQLGRIKEKKTYNSIDLIDKSTIPEDTFRALYKVTNKYGKPLYILIDNENFDLVEKLALKYFHSKSLRIPEERVDLEEANLVGYFTSIEEMGVCYIMK